MEKTPVPEQIQVRESHATFTDDITIAVVTIKPLNVKAFGAKGDGVADDFAAIARAVAALKAKGGGKLYFPIGDYRIGRGAGRNASNGGITIVDAKNITIEFERGASLLMDNLNPTTGAGDQCHGICVSGNSDGIILRNVSVGWKKKSSRRSQGDGIRFLGNATNRLTAPRNIFLEDCYTEKSPQSNVIFMGCSDITVRNLKMYDSWADGLHFNACHRGIQVDGLHGVAIGDDVLALITYYHPTDNKTVPFFSPNLTTQNNYGAICRNIYAQNCLASAVHIAGGYNIIVKNVMSVNTLRAIFVDSAIANGTTVMWTYLASKKISVSNVHCTAVSGAGIHVEAFNVAYTNDRYTKFDVSLDNIRVDGSGNDNIYFHNAKGISLSNVRCFGQKVRMNQVSDIKVDGLHMSPLKADGTTCNCEFNINGNDTAYTSPLKTNMNIHNIRLNNIFNDGGNCLIQDVRKLIIGTIVSEDASGNAVTFLRVLEATVNNLNVINCNRSNTRRTKAISLQKVKDFAIDQVFIEHDDKAITLLEVGGGDKNDVSSNVEIAILTYNNKLNSISNKIAIQSKPYAPRNLFFKIKYFSGSKTNPVWRYYSYPD